MQIYLHLVRQSSNTHPSHAILPAFVTGLVLSKTFSAKEMAAREGIALHTTVVAGHEVETIVDYAKHHHFDLLVIGFMGHSKIYGRVWGSTSQNITRLVPCTVMVVK